MTKVAAELRSGMDFGPYRVDKLQGRGGSCLVFRAHHRATGRAVALKVAHAHLTNADHHLRREAELLLRADHPNVVRVVEHLVVGDTPALVTEWVDGPSLADMVQHCGPLGCEITTDLARPIAHALDTLHARGVVHRDLSLRNILVDARNGAPVLIDLGHGRSDDVTMTVDNAAGTPRYVAPEVIRGLMVDGRADQYSLAVILHELVTGQSPFPETDNAAAALYQQLDAQPEPMREADPTLPAPMEEATLRALEKEPGDRFPTCVSFVQAFSASEPSTQRMRGFASRVGWTAAVLVLAVATVVGALAVARWLAAPELADPDPVPQVGAPELADPDPVPQVGATAVADPDPQLTVPESAGTPSSGQQGTPSTNPQDTAPDRAEVQAVPPVPEPAASAGAQPTTPESGSPEESTSVPPAAAGQAAAVPCNLLAEPSFDGSTLPEEYFQRSPSEQLMPGEGLDGSGALMIGNVETYGQYGERVLVTPGVRYGFTLHYRTDDQPALREVGVFFLDENWQGLKEGSTSRVVGASTDWQNITVQTGRAPAEAVRAVPWVAKTGGAGLLLVDEMIFAELGGCADGYLARGE